MILDLHREGVSISDIARRSGLDRKTVGKYIARGLEPPVYTPRPPRPLSIDGFASYLRERVVAFPELTGRRLWREVRDLGFAGDYTTVTGFLREVRPAAAPIFERRFETPPGRQAQVDFAQFRTAFADDPGGMRIVWLFSMVLGHSRLIWGRFVAHQDLQTVLRCHIAAFEALGGVPAEILYDRMRTVVTGEDADGLVVFNRTSLELARHYGFLPKACRPYRAKTTDEIEQPFLGSGAMFLQLTGDRVAQSGAWRCKPRRAAHDSRASVAAPVGTRRPRLVQPSVRRRYATSACSARRFSSCRVRVRLYS
jgi:transposase